MIRFLHIPPPNIRPSDHNFNYNQPHFHQGQGGQTSQLHATNSPPSTESSALHRTVPAPTTRTPAPTPTPIARIDTYLRVYHTNTPDRTLYICTYAVTLSHTNCNVNTTGSRRCAHPYVLLHPYEYRPDDEHPAGRNM